MQTRTMRRLLALGLTGAAAIGLAATASGLTGAYFSDSKSGTITGTIGAVKIATSGGTGTNGLDLHFVDLMPGEPQTVTINYQSLGSGPQDLYLTFPNRPALHALNNLGTYGMVTVTDSSSGVVFTSTNLQDGRTVPSGNSCSNIFTPDNGGCWPLPTQLLVRSNLAPGAGGTIQFTFGYPGKLSGNGPGVWNSYPSDNPPYSQAYGLDNVPPAGNGLPIVVVATQAGHTP